MTTPDPGLPRRPYIVLGELEVTITAPNQQVTQGVATFYYNHQGVGSVWLELPIGRQGSWHPHALFRVSAEGLKPFEAQLGPIGLKQSDGAVSAFQTFTPNREPLESVETDRLNEIVFALLDCPWPEARGGQPGDSRLRPVTFGCAEFDITLGLPVAAHQAIASDLGSIPRVLTHTGTLRHRDGGTFTSEDGQVALSAALDAISFAAGRWIAQCLVEGFDDTCTRSWFLWGASRASPPAKTYSWFHPDHPEWLTLACEGLLDFKSRGSESEEILRTVIYWYVRSNTLGAGVDGSLILTMCALELLSWFVIVRRCGALSEDGYGQLARAAERVRLMLTLLGMPKSIPTGLADLTAFAKRQQWPDLAEALVEARNYLVHPTQSKSGKKRASKDFPWYELWAGAQWLLELTILRLIGYHGQYHNRTRLSDFRRVEQVPWI